LIDGSVLVLLPPANGDATVDKDGTDSDIRMVMAVALETPSCESVKRGYDAGRWTECPEAVDTGLGLSLFSSNMVGKEEGRAEGLAPPPSLARSAGGVASAEKSNRVNGSGGANACNGWRALWAVIKAVAKGTAELHFIVVVIIGTSMSGIEAASNGVATDKSKILSGATAAA
jgi:hypothetical protein